MLWLFGIGVISPLSFNAQNTSNKGTDFWLGYAGHIDGTSSNMSLYITSDVSTSGKVLIPGKSWSTSYTVSANSVTVVTIPQSQAYMGCNDCTQAQAIEVTAYKPVVVYAHIYASARSDATLVLPAETMGRDYYCMGATQMSSGTNRYGQFMVVAVEDSTYVDITPTAALVSGKSAGTTYQIMLKRGDVYQGQSNSDITGTKITSNISKNKTCKKIAVFSGSSFTPFGCTSASSGDNLFQQMYPVSAWGKEFVTAPWKTRKGGDIFRVLASQGSTKVTINGWNTQTINAGSYYEWQTDTACHILADKPIIVAQYQRTQNCDNVTGDPSMVILNPVEQQLNDITLYSSPYQNITGQYINVLMKTNSTSSFTLDGSSVSWTQTPSNTAYSYCQATVSSGNHRLKADSGFNAIAYGFGNVESYGYSAGANIKNLNQFINLASGSKTCVGKATQFEGYAVYTPLSWKWYFGDGYTDTIQNPSHTYSDTGTYTVSLVTVKSNGNDCESQDSSTYTVTIYKNPTANYYTTNPCLNDSVYFWDSSYIYGSSLTKWSWNFGNGKTSTSRNPKMKFSSTGNQYVSLTVTGQTGCEATVAKNVYINPCPVPAFRVTYAVCPEDSVAILDSSTLNGAFVASHSCYKTMVNWGDGTPQDTFSGYVGNKTLKHKYTTTDTFTIRMTGWDCITGCRDSVTADFILFPAPVPNLTIYNGCQKDSIVIEDASSTSSGSIASYYIDFGDGSTKTYTPSTLPNPIKKYYSTPGQYIIKYTITHISGCAKTFTDTLTVYPKPVSAFSVPNTCTGAWAVFSENGSVSSGSIVSKQIYFGDGTDSIFTGNSISHKYTSAGTYNAKVLLYTNNGCLDSGLLSVTIYSVPQPSFTMSNGCEQDAAITFTDNSSIGSGSSISVRSWYFGDGSSIATTSTTVSHTYSAPGTYTVKLVLTSNHSCQDSLSKTVTIYEKPKAGFYGQTVCIYDSVTFTDTTTLALQQWNINFGNSKTATYTSLPTKTFTHLYTSPGTYTVTMVVTSTQGCKDTATTQITVLPQPVPDFTVGNACQEDSVQFTDNSTGGIAQRYWILGDGNTRSGNDSVFNHRYISGGTKTVTLVITGTNGCKDTISKNITIYPKPSAGFSYSASCASAPVSFTHSSSVSSGSISQYIWDFGDTTSQTQTSPSAITHMYSQGGYKNVQLIVVTNQGCRDTLIQKIYVKPLPVADFTLPNICFKDSVVFYDLTTLDSGSLTQWQFDFGDGKKVTFNNPGPFRHKYDTVGTYPVKMIVLNSWGCYDTIQHFFTVNSSPIAQIGMDPPCINHPVQFYDSSTIAFGSVYKWRWDFGDGGTDSISNPAHAYADTGLYTVKLFVASGQQCIDSTLRVIRVRPNPDASFTSNIVCADDSVNLVYNGTIHTGTLSSLFWDFGDGQDTLLAGNISSIKHKYALGGTYLVKVIANSEYGCPDTFTQSVIIRYKPVAQFTQAPVCGYDSAKFTDLSSVNLDSIAQWRWNFGDGQISTYTKYKNSISHLYTSPGNYGVTLIVTSYQGCKDTMIDTLTIFPVPQASFSVNQSVQCFKNHQFQWNDLSSIATGTYQRKWHFGDGKTDTSANPTHIYNTWGTYTITLILSSDKGCRDTAIQTVRIYPSPVAKFDINTRTDCFNGHSFKVSDSSSLDSGAWTRTWYWGDGSSDTAQSITKTYSAPGDYILWMVVKSAAGCIDSLSDTLHLKPNPKAGFMLTQPTQCEASNQFTATDTTSIAWGTYTRLWDWGDGFTDTAQTSVHSYSGPGVYIFRLFVTSSESCIDSAKRNLQVNPTPVTQFAVNNLHQCQAGNSFVFSDSSTLFSGTYTLKWDFGDGSSSTQQNPTKTYSAPGTYIVRLITTSDKTCRDTAYDTIYVHPMPQVGFTLSGQGACFPGHQINVNDTTFLAWGNYQRIWSWGDGTMDTSQNASHTYALPGTYRLVIYIQTTQGCIDSLEKQILIRPAPQAGLQISPHRTCFFQHQISYTDTSKIYSGYWTRKIDFGDGNSDTAFYGTHTYSKPGTYYLTFIVSSNLGCQDTLKDSLIIDPMPVSGFYIQNPDPCEDHQPVQFQDTTTIAWGSFTRLWNFGDGFTDTSASPQHIYQNPGTYIVSLITWSNQFCTDTATKQLIIRANPKGNISINPRRTCFRDHQLTYDDKTSIYHGYWTRVWDFGDGRQDTAKNGLHIYTSPGTYIVTLYLTSETGCQDTLRDTLILDPMPVAGFSIADHCLGDTTWVTDTTKLAWGSLTHMRLEMGDGRVYDPWVPGNAPWPHFYQSPGSFTLRLLVSSDQGCLDTFTNQIQVYPKPKPKIVQIPLCENDSIYFYDSSTIITGNITRWEWEFGDGNQLSYTTYKPIISHKYSEGGSYPVKVRLYSGLGCLDSIQFLQTVHYQPEPNFQAPDVCQSEEAAMVDISTVNRSFIRKRYWDFGDGQFSVSNSDFIKHKYNQAGTYQITLITESDLGCRDTLSKNITIHPLPVPVVQNITVCQYEEVLFLESSTIPFDSIVKQVWDFGDGTEEIKFLPFGPVTHVYSQHGTFQVRLTLTSSFGCEHDTTIEAIVYPRPDNRVVTRNVCEGDSVIFKDSSQIAQGQIVTWEWDFGDGVTRTDNNSPGQFSYYYPIPGDYSVTLRTISDQGCRDTLNLLVVVHPLPQTRFSRSVNDGCSPLTVIFKDESQQARDTIVAWIWQFGDELGSTEQNPIHIYEKPRLYQPRLTAISNAGCTQTWEDTIPIYVLSKPESQFEFHTNPVSHLYPEVRFLDKSKHATFWHWDFGDGSESFKQFPKHTYTDTGNYRVRLITENTYRCRDTIYQNLLVYPEVRIWLPNAFTPNDDNINDGWGPEGFTDGMRKYSLTIWNRWGQKVFESIKPKEKWTGNMRNEETPCQGDVYIYRIEYIDYFYKRHFRHGEIHLMR